MYIYMYIYVPLYTHIHITYLYIYIYLCVYTYSLLLSAESSCILNENNSMHMNMIFVLNARCWHDLDSFNSRELHARLSQEGNERGGIDGATFW